jgi:hypothetical protein
MASSPTPLRSPTLKTPASVDIPGSIDRPFKLAIVGGGPSGSSIIVRALRLGVITELCSGSAIEAGVCILDKDTTERFGGGRLQDYIINSNTYAAKFVTNVLSEKVDVDPPERISGTNLTALLDQPSRFAVESYCNSNLPLCTAGAFLRDVGEVVSETVSAFPASRCSTSVEVLGMQRVIDPLTLKSSPISVAEHSLNAKIIEKVSSLGLGVGPNQAESTNTLWRIETRDLRDSEGNKTAATQEIYARNVVLSTGGRQDRPNFTNQNHSAKVMVSDHACTAAGAAELKERLLAAGVNGRPGRVIIVGGSHSAFSAAWICLHKVHQPSLQLSSSLPETPNRQTALSGSYSTCNVGALCFGSGSIVMTHRTPIKVFYGTKRDADADNYTDIGHVNRVTGQIHPFGGLRGDAKELFRSIKSNRESRVRLLSLSRAGGGVNQTLVNRLYDEAAVIIWACGYSTNQPYINDIDGTQLPIRYFRGQVEVDEKAFIMSDKPLNSVTAAANETRVASCKRAISSAVDVSPSDISTVSCANTPERLHSPLRTSRSPECSDGHCYLDAITSITEEVNDSAVCTAVPLERVLGERNKVAIANTTAKPAPTVSAGTATSNAPSALGPFRIGGLLGSGLGYGFKATFDNGEVDGSSGRAGEQTTILCFLSD